MNHIFYQTKTHYSNTGDILINRALIEALRQQGKLHANCGSDIPPEFLEALQILPEEKIICNGELTFIKSVMNCALKSRRNGDKVYIFSGLGDLHGGGSRLVMRNIVSGTIFPLFRLFGVKIVRIGRSVGPISKMMAFSEVVRGLFLSHYYVRDSKSLQRCEEMGISKTKFCPDMSWIYDPDHSNKVNHTKTVMVNLRDRIFDVYEPSLAEATLLKCEVLLSKLHHLIGPEMKVCIAYQVSEDKDFAHRIYDRLKDKYFVELIDTQMQLRELPKYYGRSDIHISNRMHSLLVGYKYGSLPIALIDTNKHVKIAATFEDCGIENLMMDIYEPLNEQKLFRLYSQREKLIADLFAIEIQNRKEIQKSLDNIFSDV